MVSIDDTKRLNQYPKSLLVEYLLKRSLVIDFGWLDFHWRSLQCHALIAKSKALLEAVRQENDPHKKLDLYRSIERIDKQVGKLQQAQSAYLGLEKKDD